MMNPTVNPADYAEHLAQAVGERMFAQDTASRQTMGMALLRCSPGTAQMQMTIGAQHLNGHGICHGGFIFTLADSAFAFACNSRNQATVAASAQIEFLRPAHDGDVLTCDAAEQILHGRHGVYDVRVCNQNGEVVALFRGKSAQVKGQVIDGP